MSRAVFPAYVDSIDDAIAHLDEWVRIMGGNRLDGFTLEDQPGGGLRVKQFNVDFVGGYVLSVSMTVRPDLTVTAYSFNLSKGGTLVWRHDMHPGHEDSHDGPTHLHIGPSQNVRFAHAPVSLADVAERLHTTLRSDVR